MRRYAQTTTVPVEQTKAEIEVLLKRYKASDFAGGYQRGLAFVLFRLTDRCVRFALPIPDPKEKRFSSKRNPEREAAQEERRLWRSLLLVIKAKLESVDAGVETYEEAFLAQTVTGDGRTVAEWAQENRSALTGASGSGLPALPPASSIARD